MVKLVEVSRESGIPLIGAIAFGIIDRGTNLLQIRPTSVCNLKCAFCSTRANDSSFHPTNFVVDVDYLVDTFNEIVKFKEVSIEANLDSVGEVLTYPDLIKLIKKLKKNPKVHWISMQTNGCLISKNKLDELVKAGLDHMNLSINSFDTEKSQMLAGMATYDVKKIKELAEYAADKLSLMLTPVWIPKVNDDDIVKIIKFAKKIGAKLGIQKYEVYKYSRKVKSKALNWWKFYHQLKKWEKEFDVKLIIKAKDMNIQKAKRLPETMKKGEKLLVEVKAPGWIKDQMIGVANDRAISIENCKAKIGDKVRVKILDAKNNLYLAETL